MDQISKLATSIGRIAIRPWSFAAYVLAYLFGDPFSDFVFGDKHLSAALTEALTRVADFTSNPVVKLLLIPLIVFCLWRAGKSVERRDNALQSRIETQAIERENELEATRLSVRAEITTMIADAVTLPRIFAKHHLTRDQVQRLEDALGQTRSARHDYLLFIDRQQSPIAEMRAAVIVPDMKKLEWRFAEGRSKACFDEQFALECKDLQFQKLEPRTHGGMQHQLEQRFFFEENGEFVAAVNANANTMKLDIDRIELALNNRKAILSQIDAELGREMERLRSNG